MGFFTGKKILVIGGTGTIGRSLVRTILKDEPAVIRIFSRDEHKQFELAGDIGHLPNLRFLIGDIRDEKRVFRAMQDIDYVFHAAAMKHVPACEYNPFEAVQTNIIGTQNVIQAALNTGVKKVIFTSTDKAISPTNTYGASKLMAERLISSAQYQAGSSSIIFAGVRFGNVMGSRGSVIPLFQKQIRQKREITVTDKAMSRFMMTLRQATDLTLQAMQRSRGGEIFVLKMPVVRLDDLAELVIEKSAARYGIAKQDVRIREIGLRPGEKMYEELMTENEAIHALELEDMFVIPNPFLDGVPYYEGARKAKEQSYNSHTVEPLSRRDLEWMLDEHRLLETDDNFWSGVSV